MRRRLYLMRHAAVSYVDGEGNPVRPSTVAITEEGRRQAARAAEALASISFDRVITSGLRRTVETARIVAPGNEPEIWPAFEEIRAARLDGRTREEIATAFARAFAGDAPLDQPFLGGETIGSLVERVVPTLEDLVGDPTWDTALAVLHGGVNRAILAYALTGEPGFFGDFEQAPACINVLDIGPDRWIVRSVNYVPYDPIHTRGRLTTMEELYQEFVDSPLGQKGNSSSSS
jgi:broad specificity phosphatase PhoE